VEDLDGELPEFLQELEGDGHRLQGECPPPRRRRSSWVALNGPGPLDQAHALVDPGDVGVVELLVDGVAQRRDESGVEVGAEVLALEERIHSREGAGHG
jgi:hypothetical protein